MRSVYDAILSKFGIRPIRATTTQTGAAVDTLGFNSASVAQEVGTVTGTTPTLDSKIQESADGSTAWADISGAAFTQVTASNNSQALRLEGLNTGSRKRYIRVVSTIAGTTPSFDLGVNILLGRAFKEPVQ